MAQPALICAVGYLRKMVVGGRSDSKQPQEKSLEQQRTEIVKLAAGRFKILQWIEDEGGGWKRGHKRPNFSKMLATVQHLGAQAVLCDNVDRFSRTAYNEVQEDANALRQSGVRWIATASHGSYQLGTEDESGEFIRFVGDVCHACDLSRRISRAVSLARLNKALAGKRPGGMIPYGLLSDGKGGLKLGDTGKVKVVRWLFDQFANHRRSMHDLVRDLNEQKTPGPSGGRWWVNSVAYLLRRRCYRGDMAYNVKSKGQFFWIDATGEVVECADGSGPRASPAGKVFLTEGVYRPLVPLETFDKAQAKLYRRTDRSQRVP